MVKIFELFDDKTINDIYLLMEFAEYGQIQEDRYEDDKIIFTRNQAIYDIAVAKGKKIWPSKLGSDLEHAARWIFY